jgi:hypothetical protein
MTGTVVEGPAVFDTEVAPGNGMLQGFFAAAGLHILRPVVGNNQALTATTFAPPALPAVSTTSFSWDFSASPSIVVGYSAPGGLSAAINWFRFDQFSRPRNVIEHPLVGGAGTTFSSISGFLADLPAGSVPAPAAGQTNQFHLDTYLLLDIWDLDVTQSFSVGGFEGNIGGSLRYLHMAQRYTGLVRQTGPAASDAAFETSANSFSGIGPALLVDLRRPLGTFPFSLYASARTGLMFGSRHEDYFSAATAVTPISPTANRTDQTVWFGEIELGVEWSGKFGRFAPIARLGFEARDFVNTGNAQSIIPSLHSGDIGLYGITIQAGVGF